jgi:hypothetical protein
MIPFVALAFPVLCSMEMDTRPVRTGPLALAAPAGSMIANDSLATLYAGGQRWETFYPAVDRRKELWDRNWTNARIPDSLASRARNAGGPWRILVITEPGCSDSANSVPYIARLVENTPGLELRLVNSTAGKPWMQAHRTPDGRAATPTVLVLDAEHNIRGCWVEQPKKLQDFWLPLIASGAAGSRFSEKMDWYLKDEGREIVREIIEVLEGARDGKTICPSSAP